MENRAASVYVQRLPSSPAALEDWQEMQDEASDMARKRAREAARGNKVSEFLGEKFWRGDKTWPFLYWKVGGWQASVEMYFPKLNLAVDRYPRPTSLDRQEAAFKAAKFRENGIKYKALFPENSIRELEAFK